MCQHQNQTAGTCILFSEEPTVDAISPVRYELDRIFSQQISANYQGHINEGDGAGGRDVSVNGVVEAQYYY